MDLRNDIKIISHLFTNNKMLFVNGDLKKFL